MKKLLILIALLAAGALLSNLACDPVVITPKAPLPTPTNTGTIITSPTATPTITSTATVTPCPSQVIMGTTAHPGGEHLSNTYYVYFEQIPAPQTGNINDLELFSISGYYQVILGIYSDNGLGTAPVSLLGTTGFQTISTPGYVVFPLNQTVAVTSGNNYWLALWGGGLVGVPGFGSPYTAFGSIIANSLPATVSGFSSITDLGAFSVSGFVCP